MAILVGTCSWTDPTLVRDTDFYPADARSAEDRLRYYASIFSAVEVDSTFYAPASPSTTQTWVERTPTHFRMNVKAFGLHTQHPVAPAKLWRDMREALPDDIGKKKNLYLSHLPQEMVNESWERFIHGIEPLTDADKLGAILFQWPPWFTARGSNREYLREVRERLPKYPIAMEFRHHSWLGDSDRASTMDLLRELGSTYVCVDEPQGFPTSVPPVLEVTAPLAMIRFHGHNDANWNRKGLSAAERFRYLYSEKELDKWVKPIRSLADSASETHVLMNNCYQDYGVRNAYQLGTLLGEGLVGGPID
jgi:uncharacterized protein YecE (DUF72 family)